MKLWALALLIVILIVPCVCAAEDAAVGDKNPLLVAQKSGYRPRAGKLIPKQIIVEKIKNEGRAVFEGDVINFDYGSAKLRSESLPQLTEIAKAIKDPNLQAISYFYVDGHTNNCRLSLRRARSVMSILVDVTGIPPNKLVSRGFGERRPAHPNDGEPNRSKNRRVVLKSGGNEKPEDKTLSCKDVY
jgi:outer membrane protein OmpA-like peptidoglycan-associated protein